MTARPNYSWSIASVALTLAMLVYGAALAQPPGGAKCDVPAELTHVSDSLPLVGAHVRAGKDIRIVAIGGASTAGDAAGGPELAYPNRLKAALSERWPKIAVEVANKGVARQTASEMLQRFDRDVVAAKPALVVWEVGINDAVRGVDIDEFGRALQAGIELLKAKQIDVVLMDMQYSKRSVSIIGFEPYLQAIRRIADINHVIWFPRFEIMKHWSEAGVFDFTNVRPEERRLLAAKVYDCLGRRMADMIQKAIQ